MKNDVFAVIADPTRRHILEALAVERLAVGELVEELGVSQPTVSKHLKVLRTAGLVETEAVGQKRFYSITPEPLDAVVAWAQGLGVAAVAPEPESTGTAEAHEKPSEPAKPVGALAPADELETPNSETSKSETPKTETLEPATPEAVATETEDAQGASKVEITSEAKEAGEAGQTADSSSKAAEALVSDDEGELVLADPSDLTPALEPGSAITFTPLTPFKPVPLVSSRDAALQATDAQNNVEETVAQDAVSEAELAEESEALAPTKAELSEIDLSETGTSETKPTVTESSETAVAGAAPVSQKDTAVSSADNISVVEQPPALPTGYEAPAQQAEEERGLLAKLTRWGRRNSR